MLIVVEIAFASEWLYRLSVQCYTMKSMLNMSFANYSCLTF